MTPYRFASGSQCPAVHDQGRLPLESAAKDFPPATTVIHIFRCWIRDNPWLRQREWAVPGSQPLPASRSR